MSFDIRAMPEQIDVSLLDAAREAEPATIGHFRIRGFPDSAIRPLVSVGRIAGTAVTLALPAADSTLLHHAISFLRSGDILLIDRLGDRRHACVGGGVSVALARSGIAGVIVDGPCADPQELRDSGLPIWGRGISAITTRIQGVGGAMNVPVSIGGAAVLPGDLVIADEGGIVVLPPAEAGCDIDRARELQEMERKGMPLIGRSLSLGEASGATRLVEEWLEGERLRMQSPAGR